MKSIYDWLTTALGALLILVGLNWMWTGWDIIMVERGWASFVAGAVLAAGGATTLALARLAFVVRHSFKGAVAQAPGAIGASSEKNSSRPLGPRPFDPARETVTPTGVTDREAPHSVLPDLATPAIVAAAAAAGVAAGTSQAADRKEPLLDVAAAIDPKINKEAVRAPIFEFGAPPKKFNDLFADPAPEAPALADGDPLDEISPLPADFEAQLRGRSDPETENVSDSAAEPAPEKNSKRARPPAPGPAASAATPQLGRETPSLMDFEAELQKMMKDEGLEFDDEIPPLLPGLEHVKTSAVEHGPTSEPEALLAVEPEPPLAEAPLAPFDAAPPEPEPEPASPSTADEISREQFYENAAAHDAAAHDAAAHDAAAHDAIVHEEPADQEGFLEEARKPGDLVTILGVHESGDATYTMYSDGSIEAQTKDGALYFESLTQLRAYIESEEGA